MIPKEPNALVKYMQKKNMYEVDQFPLKDWEAETRDVERQWKQYHDEVFGDKQAEDAFSFRMNLIDYVKPFVNKRGVRDKNFQGNHHELKLAQVDKIPGYAKLVYMNHELNFGEMVPVYIRSKESIEVDVESVAKKLYKKSKKKLF